MNAFPFADYLVVAIFALAVGLTIAGALIAALSTRIIRGVSGLMICCVGLAGLYYFLHSPFLALMEILIYVGAVCVTIIFGVMLSEPDEPAPQEKRSHATLWGGGALVVAALILIGFSQLGLRGAWPTPATAGDGSVRAIGIALLTTYSLPFELISVVLLVAILGALVIARSGRTKE
jgi:NADH-quinone oxidoreductase subunit J